MSSVTPVAGRRLGRAAGGRRARAGRPDSRSLASLATRPSGATALEPAVVGSFAGAAILGAWDGGRLAAKVSGPRPQRLFALVPPAVAVLVLADALT
ncbi:hypothetical protein GCM10018793_44980 [Streptomyces sulfonofaciens]|uniref:Uncharacterized protein n=1 Tax=Streptomyces sulfonofaciens TaxID=68272 RepID=A0A919GFS6_9ACTN|nr:hypothetical protein [Streptomyces sulfonofaciens]GHH83279.1 hypothetical protein GCM10018793_44980 [Streptomyces sulfonofaciens]